MANSEDRSLTYKWLVGILTTIIFALTAMLWHNLSNQVYSNGTTITANVTAVATLTENVKILTEQVKDLKVEVKEVKNEIKGLKVGTP